MKAVIYCRYSPRPQAKADSNIRQFQKCRAYCRMQDHKIIGVFWDRQASGANDTRPGLIKAIHYACANKAVLVVAKFDRLSRRLLASLHIVRELEDAGANLASASEPIDTTTPLGRAFFAIGQIFAQLERETISERCRESYHQKTRNGFLMTRRPPYGTKHDPNNPKKIIPDPEEQETISIIKSLATAGQNCPAIAANLNTNGRPHRTQSAWTANKVERILKCLRKKGQMHVRKAGRPKKQI